MSHRLPIALAAMNHGYDVHVATAAGKDAKRIEECGLKHHVIPFARSGQNPFSELRTLVKLVVLFRKLSPDLVHLVTIKPVLYGGLAARVVGIKSVVAAVSGLGTVFGAKSVTERMRRWLVTRLYYSALKQSNLSVIFQNTDDRSTLVRARVVQLKNTRMIRGSGVELDEYQHLPEPEGKPVVVMAARLLKEKGVLEFVEAARIVRQSGLDVDMRLIGSPDPGNPTSVTNEDLRHWEQEGVVKVLGFRKDIANQYASANIVCLPSYYGEGLPKSLIEAAACGRAIITTNHPGCRDAIIPDETGLLIPSRDANALAEAIRKLLENPELRKGFGIGGRRLAESSFSVETVVEQHLAIYEELA